MASDMENAQREILAAAAIAFAPATDVPRERALTQAAISSLVAAFGDGTFSRKQAAVEIARHGTLPELRGDLAGSLFDTLFSSGVVIQIEPPDGELFRFAPRVIQGTRETQSQLAALTETVLADLFSDLSLTPANKSVLADQVLLCLAWTMKECGRQYAYQLAGKLDVAAVVDRDELVAICHRAMPAASIPGVTAERIADAVAELFAQREPHFAQFVFSLTQCFYYMRLLGLDGGLALLSEDRFHGAQFFLDTNILLPFLFKESRHHRSVLEPAELCEQQHISLHISETTIEELRRVIASRRSIKETFDQVPDELVSETRCVFLRSYRAAKAVNPTITVDEFFEKVSEPRDTLKGDWGITVLDDNVESSATPKEVDRIRRVLAESFKKKRRREKTQSALDHDTHMFLLIQAERREFGDKSAWLVTLDTSLSDAAVQLQDPNEPGFSMSLDGFLQIMSPYVRADHRQSFVDLFVELMRRNLFPREEVLELEDFRMFTDMDLTIRALPGADVQNVIRRVKKALGGNWELAERSKVAYEVQRALTDPALKYRVEWQGKMEQLQAASAAREKEQSEKIESLRQSLQDYQRSKEEDLASQSSRHESEVAALRLELQGQISNIQEEFRTERRQREVLEVKQAKAAERESRLRHLLKAVILLVIFVPLGIGAWLLPDAWVSVFKSPFLTRLGVSLAAFSGLAGFLLGEGWLRIVAFIISVLSLFAGIMRALL
jgi:predicted nucleic acid-binding protein